MVFVDDESVSKTRKVFGDHFREFSQNSSLHGVKYLSDKGRPTWDRLLWVVVLLLSALLCAFSIYETWAKWNTAPVILLPEDKSTPAWRVPFPAVTVCSSVKIRQGGYDFATAIKAENYMTLTIQEQQNLHDMCLVCKRGDCEKLRGYNVNESSVEFLAENAPPINEVIWESNYLGVNLFPKYEHLFIPALTEDGICYTFNMANFEDIYSSDVLQSNSSYVGNATTTPFEWSPGRGYRKESSVTTRPLRAMVGLENQKGLRMTLLSYKMEEDYLCTAGETIFKVYLHSPVEMPYSSQHTPIHVELEKLVEVFMQPDLTTTSANLKTNPPEKRKCLYQNESRLHYFRIYTKANCELECFARYMIATCNCVPLYLPRTKNMTICNSYTIRTCATTMPVDIIKWTPRETVISRLSRCPLDNVHCNVEETWWSNFTTSKRVNPRNLAEQMWSILNELSANIERNNRNNGSIWDAWVWIYRDDPRLDCGCLPSCTALEYKVLAIRTKEFNWEQFTNPQINRQVQMKPLGENVTLSQVKIVLSKNRFVANKRTSLYDRIDFLANCGGILGLFMGFSVLSLFEMVYFCTVSLCNKFFKYRTQNKLKDSGIIFLH